ncbi:MAG: hypothetical protein IKY94_11340 [Lachnospiraceae bacterium]|nr:hypothetical protein [Lachnospiraceae bacterium]
MEFGLIILGVISVIAFIWNIIVDDKDGKIFSSLLLTISATLFVVLFIAYEDRNTPTAKSVYEGKTTLEITYRDSIPIDTVVVFKPEFIKKVI